MPAQTEKSKPPGKLGAEKLTPEEQRRRFEELAKQAGCDETSDEPFDRALAVLGKRREKPTSSERRGRGATGLTRVAE